MSLLAGTDGFALTLTGAGLEGDQTTTRVTIGGVLCPIDSARSDSDTIVCNAAAAVGRGLDVVVTTSLGRTDGHAEEGPFKCLSHAVTFFVAQERGVTCPITACGKRWSQRKALLASRLREVQAALSCEVPCLVLQYKRVCAPACLRAILLRANGRHSPFFLPLAPHAAPPRSPRPPAWHWPPLISMATPHIDEVVTAAGGLPLEGSEVVLRGVRNILRDNSTFEVTLGAGVDPLVLSPCFVQDTSVSCSSPRKADVGGQYFSLPIQITTGGQTSAAVLTGYQLSVVQVKPVLISTDSAQEMAITVRNNTLEAVGALEGGACWERGRVAVDAVQRAPSTLFFCTQSVCSGERARPGN